MNADNVDLGIKGLTSASVVGVGGSATVFAVTQTETGDRLAAKLLKISALTETDRKRFAQEIRALETLSSYPGIVPILGSGTTQRGEPYCLMPLLAGSIQDRLDADGPIPWDEAGSLIRRVADAVQFAHDQGVLHRDLKPANILLTKHGVPLVADFGIAKLLDATSSISTNVAVSAGYAPPERYDIVPPSPMVDVYGLGATFAGMVTGRPPFVTGAVDTPAAIMRRVLDEAPPDVRLVGVPAQIARLVEQAMAKNPKDRPGSAKEFAAQLEDGLQQRSVSQVSAPMTRETARRRPATVVTEAEPSPTADHKPWLAIAGACALIITLVGVVVAWRLANRASAVALTSPDSSTSIADPTATPTPEPTARPTPTTAPAGNAAPPEPTPTACEVALSMFENMVCVAGDLVRIGTDDPVVPELEISSPSFEIEIDAFLIDDTEVTNRAYEDYVAADRTVNLPVSADHPTYSWSSGSFPEGLGDHPVVLVTQPEAIAYCAAQDKYLPTEFEWEWAARGPNGLEYPWGNSYDTSRVHSADSVEQQADVKTVPVNALTGGATHSGAKGMAGNVWEWTSSPPQTYPDLRGSAVPINAELLAVSRGGAWDSDATGVTTYIRNWDPINSRLPTVGFRCAAAMPEE